MSNQFEDIDLENGIAVVGMHCTLPGANSAQQFWNNLCDGYEAVRDLSDEELLSRGVPLTLLDSPDYVKAAIILEGIEEFDYGFFGCSPRDAAVMDPQHRKFLECAWSALEDSGHKSENESTAIGMFASAGMPWYLIRNVMTHKNLVSEMGEFQIRHLSNDKDFLATRASYAMNIHGPSLTVQTACSSSLVAVHLAIQSLILGESDIAIAGGSTIDVPHGVGYRYREEEVRSSDGRCRTFDRDSSGTAFGSGCATVVLRRLEDAIEDNDSVHAVLLGSAVNNDGSEKAGYMAPSVDYQASAIAEAIAIAGVSPESIGYFEAHGTGTKIGDPIEVAALTQAFGDTKQKQFCGLGSVKTNIGHLDTAAGVTSLIKTICCVREGKIPASLHFDKPNPEIDFENSPFYVNSELREWNNGDHPRIAGVSSLGVGGTNAHVIVCQAPIPPVSEEVQVATQVLPISAKTVTALNAYRKNLADRLDGDLDGSLPDVAYTLQEGRVPFEHRTFVLGDSTADAAAALKKAADVVGRARKKPPGMVFMFSGQGSQYPGMTNGLYESFPAYRETIDKCLAVLQAEANVDIRPVLFAERGDKEAAVSLQDTAMTQPALFVIEYALAQLWISWGISPKAMIGHSLGEYVAATIAGVFELRDALKLVALRGKLISSLPRGSMIAVALSPEDLRPYVRDPIAIAAENAPDLTVLSGPDSAVEQLVSALEADGHVPRQLHTSHAFHSSMLDPILQEFSTAVAAANPGLPELPFISNVSGTWISATEAQSAEYWARHMRSTVRFRDGIETLADDGDSVFLELGPGNTLASLAKMCLLPETGHDSLSCVPHVKQETGDAHALLTAAGTLWVYGLPVPWDSLRGGHRGRRVSLPGYAFDKHRCWLEPAESVSIEADSTGRLPIDEWSYVENWRRQLLPVSQDGSEPGNVLAFVQNDAVGEQLIAELQSSADSVTVVYPGGSYLKRDDDTFTVDPSDDVAMDELFASFEGHEFDCIVHGWTLLPASEEIENSVATSLDNGFYSLLSIARNLQETSTDQTTRFLIVSAGSCSVRDEAAIPANAAMLGTVGVIPNEIPGIEARLIDLEIAEFDAGIAVQELISWSGPAVTAYRSGVRYTRFHDHVSLPECAHIPALNNNGVYLITGAFGGLGRSIAEYLAKEFQARLVLLSRNGTNSQTDRHSRENFASYLEHLGSEVHRIEVDLASTDELVSAMAIVQQRFGKIDGVFHAAGHLDDGLIAMKSRESAAAVLSPKIEGTISLERAMDWCQPEFQLNYSSVSVLAGLPGQIDYAAANAFLDAYAREKNRTGPVRHLSIGWSSWSETGMSARMDVEKNLPTPYSDSVEKIGGAIFSHACNRDNGVDFFGAIGPHSLWYLDEHRLQTGIALLPGTAYVEIISDAFSLWRGQQPLEIRDLIFATPFQTADGEKRILHCEISEQQATGDFEVAIYSWMHGNEEPMEHIHATVAYLDPAQRPVAIQPESFTVESDEPVSQVENPLLKFGPRWSCLRNKSVGGDGARLELQLVDNLTADLLSVPWHPAMMDIATGGAPELYHDDDNAESGIVPFRYKSLRLWEPLKPHVFSLISTPVGADGDAPETNVRVVSDTGDVLVDIEGFAVRRIDVGQLKSQASRSSSQLSAARRQSDADSGIDSDEGNEIIRRLLSAKVSDHILISPRDLGSAIRSMQQEALPDEEATPVSAESHNLLDRPELTTDYVAPGSEPEKIIAGVWETALGISGIGIDDNFFELGGHSLLLTQIVSRLRRDQGWHLPLDRVFDEVTIREWAQLAGDKSAAAPKLSAIRRLDRKAYRANTTAVTKSK